MDPLPVRRVGRTDARGRRARARSPAGGLLDGGGRGGRERRARGPGPELAPERAERALEGGEPPWTVFSRSRRSASGAASQGAAGPSDGPPAARSRYDCVSGGERSERVLRSSSSSRSASRSSASEALAPGTAAGPRASARAWASSVSRAAASMFWRSASWRIRSWSVLPHAVVDGPGHGLRAGSGRLLLRARRRPRQEEAAHEHGGQHHARLGDDPARERALGRRDELLPAAHRSRSRGTKRQLMRSSPIWSQPSPRT